MSGKKLENGTAAGGATDPIVRLRVWWIPQVPGKPFYVDVETVAEGVKVMNTLAKYDIFQFENNIKPDYCNAGGLQLFDATDCEDGPEGSWVDWYDEETGEDDPEVWLQEQNGTKGCDYNKG